MPELRDIQYLGDGVYAGHDGFQVWVYTDRLEGRHYIALEPMVLAALVGYNRNIGGERDG